MLPPLIASSQALHSMRPTVVEAHHAYEFVNCESAGAILLRRVEEACITTPTQKSSMLGEDAHTYFLYIDRSV